MVLCALRGALILDQSPTLCKPWQVYWLQLPDLHTVKKIEIIFVTESILNEIYFTFLLTLVTFFTESSPVLSSLLQLYNNGIGNRNIVLITTLLMKYEIS